MNNLSILTIEKDILAVDNQKIMGGKEMKHLGVGRAINQNLITW